MTTPYPLHVQQPHAAEMKALSCAAASRLNQLAAIEASVASAPKSPTQPFKQVDCGSEQISRETEGSILPGDGSPTRVSDFHGEVNKSDENKATSPPETDCWRQQNSSCRAGIAVGTTIDDEDEEDCFAMQAGLAPPDISRTPLNHRRRERCRRQILPTLVETSSTSSAEESPQNRKNLVEAFSFHSPNAIVLKTHVAKEDDSDDDDDNLFFHDERDNIPNEKENHRVDDKRELSGEIVEGFGSACALTPPRKAPSKNHVEILRLKEQAAHLALRGREQDAIDAYRGALRMTRMDLKRIKEQLHSLKLGKKQEQRRQQAALHDDWWNVALIVAEIRTMMGILYERQGNYDRAITCCKEAREVCERQAHLDRVRQNQQSEKKSDDDNMHDPQEKVAQLTHMLKQLEVAKNSFAERLSLHETAIQLRQQIANLNQTAKKTPSPVVEGMYKQLFDTLFQVLELEVDNLGESHPQVADTLGIISDIHAERNDWDTAIQTLHRALSVVQLALGECHPGTAEKLRRLACFYQKRRKDMADVEAAIYFYNQSISAYKEASGGYSCAVGSTLNDLAVLHIHREEYDRAVALLSDALVEFDSITSDSNGIHSDTAQIWRNLGECYSRRQEWESAGLAYKNALEVQRNARRCFETLIQEHRQKMQQYGNHEVGIFVRPPLSDDESIADTLKRLAKVYSAVGKFNKACVALNDALYLYQVGYYAAKGGRTDGKDERNIALVCKNQDQIAHTLYCIAEIQEKRGLHDNAINIYSEALQLRLFSDAQRCLSDRGERENMVHCAMCLAGIGSVHMNRKEYVDACRVYNDALKFCKAHGVPRHHKIFEMVARRLAEAELLAKAAAYTIHRDEADEHIVSSTQSVSSSIESCGSIVTLEEDKTKIWEQRAQDFMVRGEYDQCVKLLITILASRKKILKRKKNEAGRGHCTKEREDLARTLVNFGTVLSRKGEHQKSFVAFQEAMRAYQANGMERSHPIFQEVEKELQKLTCSMPAFMI